MSPVAPMIAVAVAVVPPPAGAAIETLGGKTSYPDPPASTEIDVTPPVRFAIAVAPLPTDVTETLVVAGL